jgi:aminoglycoside/choline kinase family phosphotransferase
LLRHLGWPADAVLDEVLAQTFDFLADEALAQPRVWVHRDYHSRNLMVCDDRNPGVLDFQDAVIGPVTYDLVSLLRDCYIAWPAARVTDWARGHWSALRAEGLLPEVPAEQFLRWFDFMGVQRHLKAIGIFARLNYRDGKPGYLADIPRTLHYVLEVSGRHGELRPLRRLLEERGLAQAR